jgi:hypothetical protein
MGLGETTGDAYLNTVNNDNTYVTGIYPTGVHIALMGDPTLRMPYTRIPIAGAVRAAQIDTPVKGVKLSWSAPSSGSVSGYYIYRQEGTGSWQVLNGEAVWADTTYVDEQLTDNIVRYSVRAVGPVRTASGTYYDIGPASETSLTVSDVPANEVVSVMCSPNPAQQALNIRCSVNATQDVRMEIYSVSGTLVQRLLPVRTDTTLDVVWDLHDASHTRVAAGVYLLRISYGTSSFVTPVHVLP